MIVTPAFAQGAGAGGSDMLVSLLPFVLILVIMYFLILRPQQKRAKQHQEMVKNMRRGDSVVTSGGLIGKITKVVDDNEIEVEVTDGVRVRQLRSMVAEVRAKGEPVKDDAAAKSSSLRRADCVALIESFSRRTGRQDEHSRVANAVLLAVEGPAILLTAFLICLAAAPNPLLESVL